MAKAQIGDLIRVVQISDVNERIEYEHEYKVGEIYEVVATYEIGEGDDDEPMARIDTGALLYDYEYEIHRKAGEEDAPVYTCDYCETKLGEIACSSHLGGAFCSTKCADSYVCERGTEALGMTETTPSRYDSSEQACNIRRAGAELTELLVRKNHDYGDSFSQQYGKYGLMSALIRMDDKMRRLETLQGGQQAEVSESISDTLLDLAGYALLAYVETQK